MLRARENRDMFPLVVLLVAGEPVRDRRPRLERPLAYLAFEAHDGDRSLRYERHMTSISATRL